MITAIDKKGAGAATSGLTAAKAMGTAKTSNLSHHLKIVKMRIGVRIAKAVNSVATPSAPKVIFNHVSCVTVSGVLASTAFMMLSDAIEDSFHTKPKSQIVSMRLATLRNSF